MVDALDSRSSGLDTSPGQGLCVVFLGKTIYSRTSSSKFNVGGNPAIDVTLPLYDLFNTKTVSSMEKHDQFFFPISFSSQSNQNVTKAVIEALVADQGGTENCPWSPAEMKSMFLHDCIILTIYR